MDKVPKAATAGALLTDARMHACSGHPVWSGQWQARLAESWYTR